MVTMLTSELFIGYDYFTFFFYRFLFCFFSLFLFTLTVTAGLNDPRVAYWEPGGSHFYFNWLRFFISFFVFFVFFVSHFSCLNLLLFLFSQKLLQPLYKSFLNYFFSCCFFICIFAIFVNSIISSI